MSLTVELHDVIRIYGKREALAGTSCRFLPGRINVLLGPNGCGKTTLLRHAALLEAPDRGTVVFSDGDLPVAPGKDLMQRMTLVSQAPVLFNTTVFRNMAYGLQMRGCEEGEVKRRVSDALELVGMGGFAGARAASLSGGEAQRVAIARAYALRPEMLLLDEPSSNLDPEGGAVFEDVLRKLNAEQGTTVVIVTHNLFQARRLAHAAFFMYGGKMVEWGDAAGFFNRPEKAVTAKFISGEIVF